MNNIKGSLILLLTAFIWGTAFVAQTSGAGAVGTFTFNAARSIVGALFLAVVIVIKNVLDKIPWTLYHFRKYKWVKDLTHTGMEQKEKS